MNYSIPPHINPNKAFIVNRSDLEGRIEPEYYRPEIAHLEEIIRAKSDRKLKHYIQKMASGATPSVQEEEKYYSDMENGIPFLRVQNLQTNGQLNTDDAKYVNIETHNSYLKRSQVKEHDLLVKITGVGRMAIASVAPDNFAGNTNQHIVVIKTVDKKISRYLANYLNLDIVEKLSSRRSTGGTRPALDYPALRSIPIIEGLNFSVLEEAEQQKQLKESEAKLLLQSIDNHLLNLLGIQQIEKVNDLLSRVYPTTFSEITGGRLDPYFQNPLYKQLLASIKLQRCFQLKELIKTSNESWNQKDHFENTFPYIEISEINLENGKINNISYVDINQAPSRAKMIVREGDIIVSTTRPHRGAIAKIEKEHNFSIASTGFAVLRNLQTSLVSKDFLFAILRSQIVLQQFAQRSTGGNYPAITLDEIGKVLIPIPSLEKQNEITSYVDQVHYKVDKLREEAKKILKIVKIEIEKQILE